MKKQIIPVLGSITLCIIILLDLLYLPVILPLIEQRKVLDENRLYQAEVGDIIRFGEYEQDNDLLNGKEPIEWQVLERDGDNILVISRYVLDARAYHDKINIDVTWETCSMREWLNGSFFENAFNEKQKERLLSTKVRAHANPFENVYTGKDTIDKVFLLSTYEVLDYYGGTIYDGGRNREILATEYAIAQGVSIEWKARTESGYLREGETVKVKEGTCNWWLRTQGRDGKTAVFIFQDGKISCLGSLNYSRNVGVRPAIWISTGR